MPILINHTIYGKDKRCELISNSIFVSKNRKNRSYSIMEQGQGAAGRVVCTLDPENQQQGALGGYLADRLRCGGGGSFP